MKKKSKPILRVVLLAAILFVIQFVGISFIGGTPILAYTLFLPLTISVVLTFATGSSNIWPILICICVFIGLFVTVIGEFFRSLRKE